jgi:spore coat polysaccharide biosynthesis predicted glycosyltransferase SpsG
MTNPPRSPGRMLIRAAAGRRAGAGHVMRTLALAEGVRARGGDVVLSADLSDLDWITLWVTDLGIELVAPAAEPDTLAELARGRACDVVVLDDYTFAPARSAVDAVGALLLNVEDGTYGRRVADVVVDGSIGAETRPRPDDDSGTVLRGVSFAPIRAEIRAARGARPIDGEAVRRVVVVMGGTDARGVAETVREAVESIEIHVSVPAAGLGLLSALEPTDAVISAAGVSAVELCCLGVPTGLIRATDNQEANYRSLEGAGAVTGLGSADEVVARPEAFAARVREWLSAPARLTATAAEGRRLVDGRGVDRILDAVEEFAGSAHPSRQSTAFVRSDLDVQHRHIGGAAP